MVDQVFIYILSLALLVLIVIIYSLPRFFIKIILIRPASEPVSWSEAAPGVPVRVMVPGGSDSSVNATSAAARTLRTFPEVEIRTEGVFTISSADCGTTGASSALPLTSEEVRKI